MTDLAKQLDTFTGVDSKSVGGVSPSLICGPVVCIYYLSVIHVNANNRAFIAHMYL